MPLTRREFLLETAAAAALSACSIRSAQGRGVAQVLSALPTIEGAGVHLTRAIGQPALRNLDPFVLLDRFHSANPADYVPGFPRHPHRGFETVTIMLEGRFEHRDSVGNHGVISGGGAQWMTAGRGILHSEMPAQNEGWLHGFQLWVNLPAAEKMCPAFYQDLTPDRLAEGMLKGARLRVIAGEVEGLQGPVRPRPTQPLLATITLEDDRQLELSLPEGHTAFACVTTGQATIGSDSTLVPAGSVAVLGPGNRLRLRALSERTELLLAAGRPLGEPIVQHGPFVMNTEEEIARAFADYRAGVLDRG